MKICISSSNKIIIIEIQGITKEYKNIKCNKKANSKYIKMVYKYKIREYKKFFFKNLKIFLSFYSFSNASSNIF